MERVIVTVKLDGEARVRDMDVPADVKADRLAGMIAESLHWDMDALGSRLNYEIKAAPGDHVLEPDQTLQDANIWDGAWLIFRPKSQPIAPFSMPTPPPDQQPEPSPQSGPFSGFDRESLGDAISQATGGSGVDQPVKLQNKTDKGYQKQEEDSGSGFVWKKLT